MKNNNPQTPYSTLSRYSSFDPSRINTLCKMLPHLSLFFFFLRRRERKDSNENFNIYIKKLGDIFFIMFACLFSLNGTLYMQNRWNKLLLLSKWVLHFKSDVAGIYFLSKVECSLALTPKVNVWDIGLRP